MNQRELSDLLLAAAEHRARSHGVHFGQGADGDIRRLAQEGAERIITRQRQVNRGDQIVLDAESTFERLVDEMIRAVDQIQGYRAANPNVIGEQTLAIALSKLCPCFPIC